MFAKFLSGHFQTILNQNYIFQQFFMKIAAYGYVLGTILGKLDFKDFAEFLGGHF